MLLVNDPQDRNITAGVQQIVWAYGSSDTLSFHGNTKGTYGILFYGDDLSHQVENEIKGLYKFYQFLNDFKFFILFVFFIKFLNILNILNILLLYFFLNFFEFNLILIIFV